MNVTESNMICIWFKWDSLPILRYKTLIHTPLGLSSNKNNFVKPSHNPQIIR